jgi:pimeloyl-ACP methyl ester carboxylesterase
VEGSGWDYGVDVAYIRDLCEYWRTQYDWRAQERRLNEYPLFLSEVDGLDIHFWHVKGRGERPLPLLLVHGWPGSIYEFLELIGPLSDPAGYGGDPADSFDLVIPSLPGFGFGGQPRVPGWGVGRIAAAFDTLMVDVLGYPQ